MLSARRKWAAKSRLYQTLYFFCAANVHITATLAQAVGDGAAGMTVVTAEEMIAASGIALIPSAPRDPLLPSPLKTTTRFPTGIIPSAPRSSSSIPSEPSDEQSLAAPPATRPERPISISTAVVPAHTGLIPSAPISPTPSINTGIASFPVVSIPTFVNGTIPISATNVAPSLTIPPPGMTSTQEGLHPIPAPSTISGDPDGHHEIPEPGFSITLPCRGCSPVVEISATGWETVPTFPINVPPAQEVETKTSPAPAITPIVTLPIGPSNVVVKPDPSGSNFIIGDSTTAKLGQTVIVGNTPVVVHTSGGLTNVVVGGSQTIPFQPPSRRPAATVTVGGSPIVVRPAPSGGNFIVGDSTVSPGQTITISNTPLAVQTDNSNTRIVIGGTQTIPLSPLDAQITDAPMLLPITLDGGTTITPIAPADHNSDAAIPQGLIISSQALLPGGPPLTISGTIYSLLPSATELVVNGQTTTLHPSWGTLQTSISAAPLTLWNHVYTANRAGYYSLAPGTTLVPGGPAVTMSGSVISLEPQGTAAIIQGSTSAMEPVTAIVTLARSSSGLDGGETGAGVGTPLPTVGKHSGGVKGGGAWIEGWIALGVILVGWLGVWS